MWNTLRHTRNLVGGGGTSRPSALPIFFPPKNSCYEFKKGKLKKKMGMSGGEGRGVCKLRTGSNQSSAVSNWTAS
jgi:hypothetical protein